MDSVVVGVDFVACFVVAASATGILAVNYLACIEVGSVTADVAVGDDLVGARFASGDFGVGSLLAHNSGVEGSRNSHFVWKRLLPS